MNRFESYLRDKFDSKELYPWNDREISKTTPKFLVCLLLG